MQFAGKTAVLTGAASGMGLLFAQNFAALGGQKTEIDLKNIYVRNVRIIGSTLRSRPPQVKAQILSALVRDVWQKVAAGEIRPTIYKVLPITDAEKAQDILYRGENVGKVVLTVE